MREQFVEGDGGGDPDLLGERTAFAQGSTTSSTRQERSSILAEASFLAPPSSSRTTPPARPHAVTNVVWRLLRFPRSSRAATR